MQRYANVDEQKHLPFPKGRGTCPCCGGLLIAKCGKLKAHHWAHDRKDDCDRWSEPIGAWHLWWQNLVRPEFVEVVRGPHRADVVGNDGVVVELQHSSINAEDIAAREGHYGNMVWVFDATKRFSYMKSGTRAFFSVGQTKHLNLCKNNVFLDFGFDVVQVERFTNAITLFSGFGLARSRDWFAETFLSEVREPGSNAGGLFVPEGGEITPWDKKSPVRKLEHDTKWIDASSGRVVTFAKWTEYIKVTYCHYMVGDSQNKCWDYDKVIDFHPEIANGWKKIDLQQMLDFFCGTAVILGGLLRVLPSPAAAIPVKGTVSATEHLLRLAEEHIQAGRLPILKESTRQGLLEKAREYEIREYDRPLRREPGNPEGGQRFLFE